MAYGRDNYGGNLNGGSNWYYGSGYQNHESPSWGYIILYLVVLVISVVGNTSFILIVKKNPLLHRTIHFFFMFLAVRDLITTVLVIPFLMDSLSKSSWHLPEFMCKFWQFLAYGMRGVHAYTLVFAAFFLYFFFRNIESHATETGEIVTRKTKMHKWAIPLAWVIGLGAAIPAGALASVATIEGMATIEGNSQRCELWHQFGHASQVAGKEYYLELACAIKAFIVPLVLFALPLLALVMQIGGCRTPHLDPPHNRTAWTLVAVLILFIGTQAPFQCQQLMRFFGNQNSNRMDLYRGFIQTIETELTMTCLVYVPCMIHPLLYIMLNPQYRSGLKVVWQSLYCNKNTATRDREEAAKKQNKYRNPPPIIRPGRGDRRAWGGRNQGDALVAEVQPMIMPMQQVNILPKQEKVPYQQQATPKKQHVMHGTPYIPTQARPPAQQPLLNTSISMQYNHDTSFEEPQLPAQFEYGQFKYTDTARVEPKIAYTPINTPSKTSQVPHFDMKPFKQPNYRDGTWVMPPEQVACTGSMPASQIPIEGFPLDPNQPSTPAPVDVDDQAEPDPFEIESLESSPGSSLRMIRRGVPDVAQLQASPGVLRRGVAMLETSPGAKRRNRQEPRLEDAQPRTPTWPEAKLDNAPGRTSSRLEDAPARIPSRAAPPAPAPRNRGRGRGSSPPITNGDSAEERPSSRQGQTMEIMLTGRTRSRQDLCPDRPQSKFEHSV